MISHDVTGFFPLCVEFSFICTDDKDSSHFIFLFFTSSRVLGS